MTYVRWDDPLPVAGLDGDVLTLCSAGHVRSWRHHTGLCTVPVASHNHTPCGCDLIILGDACRAAYALGGIDAVCELVLLDGLLVHQVFRAEWRRQNPTKPVLSPGWV